MAVKVKEIIKKLENDGWVWIRTTGSHRHFRHPTKSGIVTIPGKMSDDLNTRNLKQYSQASKT